MMLFDTYVAPSAIEGLGLFANEDIPADTRVWCLDHGFDIMLTEEKLKTMPIFQKNFFLKYCYKFRGMYFYCVDNSRFMNHSEQSNVIDKVGGTYSTTAIKKGEEIVINYASMGESTEDLEHNVHNLTSSTSLHSNS